MRALITQREVLDSYGELTDVLEARYTAWFARLGVVVYPVPNFLPKPEDILSAGTFDALILTGGGSIPQKFYHEPRKDREQPHRDKTERCLLQCFRAQGKPILAICRGMQYINALWGGKISRMNHLAVERPIRVDHTVEIAGKEWQVNQYHNDGIFLEDLAEGLEPLAIDRENGVVEAFTVRGERILALQWHPERPFADKQAETQTERMIRIFLGLGDGER